MLLVPARGCNCRVCPFSKSNPTAPEPICSGQNSDCAYCGCARTEGAQPAHVNPCRTCSIRCGSRTDITAWMADVGGTLGFDDIAVDSFFPEALPRFVPLMDGSSVREFDQSDSPSGLHWPAYGARFRQVFRRTTHVLSPMFAELGARGGLQLTEEQMPVLVGYAEDPLVEAFWSLRRRDQLVERITAMNWSLILSPNFSMYGNQPRTEHLLNFRRNLLLAEEFAQAGAAVAPNIYWFRKEDLDRYLDWARDTQPVALAVNLQTFRTPEDWDEMAMPGLSYLASRLDGAVKLVANGTSRADRIADLRRLFGDRLYLVSQNAVMGAQQGKLITDSGWKVQHAARPDLFAANVRYYADLMTKPMEES